MINATAITTEIPRAFSGLGNFFFLNNSRFRFQTIPLPKGKVYTPSDDIPFVTNNTEIQRIKLMIIR
jgi:hypothetical protein